MSIISEKDVEKVAKLGRINLSDAEKMKFAEDLSVVLDNFKDLQKVEVNQPEEVSYRISEENALREDEAAVIPEEEKEQIRQNFPQRKNNFLKVKRVL